MGRQRLHSSYDPEEEGREWARAQDIGDQEPVVILGLGLGYHVLPFLREGRPVWVVEPSAAVARLALEHQDLNSLWADGGLAVGRDFTGVPKGLPLLAYPPSRRLHSGLYQRLGEYLAGEDDGGAFSASWWWGPSTGIRTL